MIYDLKSLRGEERIDSRDLIETRDALKRDIKSGALDSDELEDATALIEAIDALEAEWFGQYGASFIREDTFEDYARELAEDIGAVTGDEHWPHTCINWERAADELAMDYSGTRFLGYEYYVR